MLLSNHMENELDVKNPENACVVIVCVVKRMSWVLGI